MAKVKPRVTDLAGSTATQRTVGRRPIKKAEAEKSPPLMEVPLPVGIAYRVDEAARRIDIGKTKMWGFVWAERIPARKIDGATVILHDDLVEFVRSSPLFERAKADQ